MSDYLEIYKKFKDVKDIKDYIDDVENLRFYYEHGLYNEMQQHIWYLMSKYIVETVAWNGINREMPTSYQQAYINAENFLRMEGAILIVKKVINYHLRLTANEVSFIDSMTKLMEQTQHSD